MGAVKDASDCLLSMRRKKLKVKRDRLEAWEAGTEQPTFAQLKKIAKLYKTHLSIFICRSLLLTFDRLQITEFFRGSQA